MAHLVRVRRAAPYAWQYDLSMVAGESNDAGDGFRYRTVVLSVPRRAGKTTWVLAANLDRLDLIVDARGWFTCANGREVAAKLYRDEWVPMLEPLSRLYRLRKSQGSEGIHKRRGSSRFQLFAPTPTALHSTNVDTATVDEAWAADLELGEAIEGGITPAQLTRPWRQTLIVSAGGTIESTWFDRWLETGERGVEGVALFDYGADATAPGYDPGDPAVWRQAHPTAGIAFPLEVLAAEYALAEQRGTVAEFERAYLNVWPRPSSALLAAGLDLEQWRAAAAPDVAPVPAALAVDVAADRSSAALAVAGAHPDDPTRIAVEILDHRRGLDWLAGAVADARGRYRAPVVADSLVAASIIAELKRRRVKVDPIGASDHARACSMFVDRLAWRTLTHRSQGVLDEAILGARRRPLGDAWLWSRRNSAIDISPLVAATLAVFAAVTKPRPTRKPSMALPAPPGKTPASR